MSKKKILIWVRLLVFLVATWTCISPIRTFAQADFNRSAISTAALNSEVRDFFAKEVAVHFSDIKTFIPPPERVNGSITTGEYTWGSFMRVVAAQSDIGGSPVIAGKETARSIAEMGLYEARKGGKAFSQLYAAQALRHYGADLSKNAVWNARNGFRSLMRLGSMILKPDK
jgi:hypothetical protein